MANNTSNGRHNRYQSRPQHTHAETAYSRQHHTTTLSHFNTRLDHIHIDSNPLLRSLYNQVNSMVQQSSGQDVPKILFAVLSAINDNLSNPDSPLSMNPDVNNLRQLYSLPQNGRISLTLSLLRSSQQSTTSSLPPPPQEEMTEETNSEESSFSYDSDSEEMTEEETNSEGSSSYDSYGFDSDLLPPPPETWSDTDMSSLIDQAIDAEEMSNTPPFYSAYGAYR